MPEANTSRFGFLGRKVGPLPVIGWALIAVGGYYAYTKYKGSSGTAATPAAGTTADGTTGTPAGSITQNLTENITGPLTTSTGEGTDRTRPRGKKPPRRPPPKPKAHKCPPGWTWDPDAKPKARCVHHTEKEPAPTPGGGKQIFCPKGTHREIRGGKQVCVPDTAGSTTQTVGTPAPLVSTVQQAGIITSPAYLDTSGQYQREPARVPRLVYPVVPDTPGQPPVSPADEAEPAATQQYAPMTAGAIYDTASTAG
jgi:hypothetical protein